jgi:hypothetical protein
MLAISNPNSKIDIADWVEFFIITEEQPISKTELSSFIEEASGSEPDQLLIDDVWLEMNKRELLYGVNPPFITSSREIVPTIDWRKNPEYLTCLILDLEGNSTQPTVAGKLFERISGEAIKSFLGGSAIIYGFPSKQTVEEIAAQMNERFNYNPTSNFKDRGVDIIAWKPFDDTRESQIVVLMQCAAGQNWRSKLLQVPLDAWCQYISWGNKPIKGFTTADIVEEKDFHETVVDAGLMFDRTRIYRHTSQGSNFDPDLRNELRGWCETRLATLLY